MTLSASARERYALRSHLLADLVTETATELVGDPPYRRPVPPILDGILTKEIVAMESVKYYH